MPANQKRDNAYYEKRLEEEFPHIHADWKSGRYPTLSAALKVAGLKKGRSRLQELKNAWEKASKAEQDDFSKYLEEEAAISISAPSTSTPVSIAVNQQLTIAASKRISEIMVKRGMKIGDVMSELGLPRLNASLGGALARRTRLQPALITLLEEWLEENAEI